MSENHVSGRHNSLFKARDTHTDSSFANKVATTFSVGNSMQSLCICSASTVGNSWHFLWASGISKIGRPMVYLSADKLLITKTGPTDLANIFRHVAQSACPVHVAPLLYIIWYAIIT